MSSYDFTQARQKRLANAMEILLTKFRSNVATITDRNIEQSVNPYITPADKISERENVLEDMFTEAESSEAYSLADLTEYLAWELYDMPMSNNNPYRKVMEA